MNLLLRFAFFSLLFFCTNALAQIDRVTGKAFATRSEVLGRHGMVWHRACRWLRKLN
jgi:hypothetical protein